MVSISSQIYKTDLVTRFQMYRNTIQQNFFLYNDFSYSVIVVFVATDNKKGIAVMRDLSKRISMPDIF